MFYRKDKLSLDSKIYAFNKDSNIYNSAIMDSGSIKGNTTFLYPFGLCVTFTEYDADKDFHFRLYDQSNNLNFNNMFVFITDPAMLTFSSIDQQSHQGITLFGLKPKHHSIYNIEIGLKDSNNPSERESCSLSAYADCVDDQTNAIFNKVTIITNHVSILQKIECIKGIKRNCNFMEEIKSLWIGL